MKYLVLVILLFPIIFACHSELESKDKLLLQNCGNCHIVPSPSVLTADIWEKSVFPTMADYFLWDTISTHAYANKTFYQKKGRQPMTDELWSVLIDHFVSNALPELTIRKSNLTDVQHYFDIETFDEIMTVPAVTAVKMAPNDHLWISSRDTLMDYQLKTGSSSVFATKSRILDIDYKDDSTLYLLNVGRMRPHDNAIGSLNTFNLTTREEEIVLDKLKRPVRLTVEGETIYVSEFGHQFGQVSTLAKQNLGDKKALLKLPGCYRVFESDLENNGSNEIIVQCSQALEGIYRINQSDGDIRKLIAFPPETGLSDLEIADLNNDGLPDFILTLGDNADYSNMPKEFHGVRIYMNQGNQRFKEVYRFDHYGSTQVNALHLNDDDKIDFVLSSYFPMSNQYSILVFKQLESEELEFDISVVPESLGGRWMTTDVGDLDEDGDLDMVFGGYILGPTIVDSTDIKRWYDKSIDVLVLRNKLK